MKKLILCVSVLVLATVAIAQPVKTTKPKTPPVAAKPVLKNSFDSASYAMGMSFANFFKQQGVNKVNSTLVLKAINDLMGNKKPLIDDNTANMVINNYLTQMQLQKSKAIIDSGVAFLKRNKTKPGVKTTASGLQYEVIKEGDGIKPAAVDTFVAHYRGTLLDGFEFDASYNRGQPLTLGVSQVIRGWTEGLQLMSVGSKYKFWIPYELAYGAMGQGQIPGGAMLIFEVELLDVKKAASSGQ